MKSWEQLNNQLIKDDIPLQVRHMEKEVRKPVLTKPSELTGKALLNYKRQLEEQL